MKIHPFRAVLRATVAVLTLAAGSVIAPPDALLPTAAAAGQPQTMPALQQWSPGPATTTITSTSRIVVNAASGTPLFTDAQTFDRDLGSVTGYTPTVVTGTRSSAVAGDIYLTLDPALAGTVHNAEGYQLESGGFIAVGGVSTVGVFNGTRTLLQLLRQSSTVAGGIAIDWPVYAERGIRIDTVPRTYSSNWWHNLIREMAYTKLNMLQTLLIGGYGLTQPEIDDIKSFAASYHVSFTPTVALAGHADPILDAHPELELVDPKGATPGTGRSLDYSKLDFTPGVKNVVQQYLDTYVPQTGSDYFHVSGDEFIAYPGWADGKWTNYPQLLTFAQQKVGPTATARDGYIWYMNWLDEQIKARGKKMRVWNDTLENSPLIALNSDVQVEFWYQGARTDSVTPVSLTATNKLLNVREDTLYYDMSKRTVDAQKVYDQFTPTQFPNSVTVPASQAGNITGAMIAAWMGDQGPQAPLATNEQLLDQLRMPLRALAQKTWASPNPGTYSSFAAIDSAAAPGVLVTAGTATNQPAFFPDGSGRFLVRTTAGALMFGQQGSDSMWRTSQIATGVAGNPVTLTVGGAPYFTARTAGGRLMYGALGATGWRISDYGLANAAGDPALALDSSGRAVYATRTSDGGLWSGREDLPAQQLTTGVTGDPSLIIDVNSKLTWFALTAGAAVRHGWQSSPSGPWDPTTADLVTGAAGKPVVARDVNGKLCLFVHAANGDLVHRWQETAGGGWQAGSAVLVSGTVGDATVLQDANHALALFVRTTSGDIVHRWQAPAGGAWDPGTYTLLTGMATDPGAVLDGAGRLVLFAAGSDGNLWHRRQSTPAGGWAPAQMVFSGLATVPAIQATGGRLDYLAVPSNSYLVHGWHNDNADGTDSWSRWIVMSS